MLEKRMRAPGVIIIIYLVIIFFLGVVFVPCFEVWGPEKNINGYGYVFLFSLNRRATVNGFEVYYVIDYLRTLYTTGIVTLIAAGILLLLRTWKKEDKIES